MDRWKTTQVEWRQDWYSNCCQNERNKVIRCIAVNSQAISASQKVWNLGVVLDKNLNFKEQIN